MPSPLGSDTIYMNMRSVLQIMTFLSKGVCVPEEHVRTGIAPMTPGPDGRPFDWTRVTAGNFFVNSQKHRPHDAEVAVQYRGYWFYIASNDVNSRAVLADPRDPVRAPGVGRQERRPAADAAAGRVS